ncbi:chaperone modulator CbpM [Marinimicrobium sp. ABcell2]|uniref:chaperone modulator CbpM n=1 Tax=Marinimicrobium sp. ABcell2 TaxID=3069751 RepID=UPI0027B66C14|nr:chaperone modulator CbpM [Marinimicrobium sp. ABcell2]MDQ2075486.1 chaperone modulator CbpM [Marinimicrobium sp. ABcell2]
MQPTNITTLSGCIVEDELELTLGELTRACSVRADFIVELVDEGIIQPRNPTSSKWTFGGESLPRLRTAVNLQRDLDINLAGVALALELMEEIEALRAELNRRPGLDDR